MFGAHGMVQHAIGRIPDLRHGFCVDDNARSLIVGLGALGLAPDNADAQFVAERSLAFVEKAQRPDGLFINFMDADGVWLEEVGSPESIGRSLWALGIAARCAPDADWRTRAATMLRLGLRAVPALGFVRSRSYAALGIAAAIEPAKAGPFAPAPDSQLDRELDGLCRESLNALLTGLRLEFERAAEDTWPWWEDRLTYANARLPDAMLRGGAALGDDRYTQIGLRSLEFLGRVTQSDGVFVPIGNAGWYRHGQRRAIYDQQPIEAAGMVDAWLAAERATSQRSYIDRAVEAIQWYLGRNSEGLPVAVPEIGASHDGLLDGTLNPNMGAESTLSYLHAHLSLAHRLKA